MFWVPVRKDLKVGLIIIFSVALTIRLAYFILLCFEKNPSDLMTVAPDCHRYISIAQYIAGNNPGHEYDMFLTGPGYAAFLALLFQIFGLTPCPAVIIQIILSSINCSLIFLIAETITGNKSIAYCAAVLSAISLTSIALSMTLLGETLFFFLMLMSLFFYLRALSSGKKMHFIISGVFGGFSILVRAVSQFLPFLFLIFLFFRPFRNPSIRGRTLFSRALYTVFIMLGIAGAWGMRNYLQNGVLTVSETGTRAARTYLVAQVVADRNPDNDIFKLRNQLDSPRMINGIAPTAKQDHVESLHIIWSTFSSDPWQFLKVYLGIVWENMRAPDLLHLKHLSRYMNFWAKLEKILPTTATNSIMIYLSLAGMVALLLRRNFTPLAIFSLLLAYFALLTGVTSWQGSRPYFPGQIGWTPLVSILAVEIYLPVKRGAINALHLIKKPG